MPNRLSAGPLNLTLAKDIKTSGNDDTVCTDTNEAGVVKGRGGYIMAPSSSGTTTTCGHSSWYNTAMQTQLAGFGYTKLRCTSIVATHSFIWGRVASGVPLPILMLEHRDGPSPHPDARAP